MKKDIDQRLQLTDAPRDIVSGVAAETPLISIAWRAIRAEHQQRAEERRRGAAELKRLRGALAATAEEVYRLYHAIRRGAQAAGGDQASGQSQQLLAIIERIKNEMAKADIAILAPEGEPFTTEMMELFENIAQQVDAEADAPRIAEVIAPAIMCRGAVLSMGKAVIAIPAKRIQEGAEELNSGQESETLDPQPPAVTAELNDERPEG